MSNRISSYQIEKMRRGKEFFDLAAIKMAEDGSLHDSFYMVFKNQFDNVLNLFEEHLKNNEIGLLYVDEEYLHTLIADPTVFLQKFNESCIANLQAQLANAFDDNKLRSIGGRVQVVWSYMGQQSPNEYIYTLELKDFGLNWKLISGRFEVIYDSGELELPLPTDKWFPE